MRELIDQLPRLPRSCTWELTLRCNLRCRHCGSAAGQPRGGELPRERALALVDELADLRCRKISLSGGEPTLAAAWPDIAARGARRGLVMNMIVNGSIHGRDFVRRARDAGLAGLGVSLDGLEEAHDRLRGLPGLFGRVMQLLDDCAAESMPVGVITTIWSGNRHDLEAVHERIAGRAYAWQLQLGNAMGNLAAADQIAPEDLLDLIPTIAGLIRRRAPGETPRIDVADNIGYFGPFEETLRRRRRSPLPCWTGCYAGCQHLGLEADGGVKGCLALQSTRATEGNVQSESLREVWSRPGAFAYNRQFAVSDLAGFCRTCDHARICRGGCLSMRLAQSGGENRYCYHRVASLAAQRAAAGRRRYVAKVYAPAALAALLGLGCQRAPLAPAPPDFATAGADLYGIAALDLYGIAGPDLAAGDRTVQAPDLTEVDTPDMYGIDDDGPGWFTEDMYGLPPDDMTPIEEPDLAPITDFAQGRQDGPAAVDLYGLRIDLGPLDMARPGDLGPPRDLGAPDLGRPSDLRPGDQGAPDLARPADLRPVDGGRDGKG